MRTNFHARVLAHSKAPSGVELLTMEWTFPRNILAEVNTHRMKSSNAASSRAIPHKKMRDAIVNNPFIPEFQKNQAGMQSGNDLSEDEYIAARSEWLYVMTRAVSVADSLAGGKVKTHTLPLLWHENQEELSEMKRIFGKFFKNQSKLRFSDGSAMLEADLNVHKQFTNRLLEPFMWTTIIISATDWDNLFSLRFHPAAEPSFQRIAELAWTAQRNSRPVFLAEDEWHLPLVGVNRGGHKQDKNDLRDVSYTAMQSFIMDQHDAGKLDKKLRNDLLEIYTHDRHDFTTQDVSAGRCARVSYTTHEGIRDMREDVLLALKLSVSRPGHWSPFEHVARPAEISDMSYKIAQLEVGGNMIAFTQGGKYGSKVVPKDGEIGYCGNFRGWKQYRKFFENENMLEFSP